MPIKAISSAALASRSRHKPPNISAISIKNIATPSSTGRVPIHWIRTKPVMNTPNMLPAVDTAYILPTTLPVCERSLSRNFITTGVTIPSMTLGSRNSVEVMSRMRGTMLSAS